MKCAAESTSTPGVHCVIVHMLTKTHTQITRKNKIAMISHTMIVQSRILAAILI
jgi:hypothetical protein